MPIPKLVVLASGGNHYLAERLWEQPLDSLEGFTPAEAWGSDSEVSFFRVMYRWRVLNAIKGELLTDDPVDGPTNGSGKPPRSLLAQEISRRRIRSNSKARSIYRD